MGVTAGLVVAALFLAACGGKPAATPPATTLPPTPKTSPPATTSPAPPKVDPAVLRAKGEEIFQKTAGGVGCKACHGVDGKGGNLGPNIRGKTADELKRALGGDAMSFIQLSNADIEAVVEYLKYLASQP
ncbi:MAG: cytochrome c [Chloroflexi bacterium]|nr:cytochrome c [Chloroflexota bacterium]